MLKLLHVFHESLPVTTSVAMVTSLQLQVSSTRQHPSFYGNQDMYQNPPQMYGDKLFEAQFDNHHGYQGQQERGYLFGHPSKDNVVFTTFC